MELIIDRNTQSKHGIAVAGEIKAACQIFLEASPSLRLNINIRDCYSIEQGETENIKGFLSVQSKVIK